MGPKTFWQCLIETFCMINMVIWVCFFFQPFSQLLGADFFGSQQHKTSHNNSNYLTYHGPERRRHHSGSVFLPSKHHSRPSSPSARLGNIDETEQLMKESNAQASRSDTNTSLLGKFKPNNLFRKRALSFDLNVKGKDSNDSHPV